MTKLQAKQRADLTYKYNQKQGRHGWLRLTPAYSIKAVLKYLKTDHVAAHVLDPFSGTGTTGLLCAELGITCDLLELNPFLVWFTQVKTRNYTEAELQAVQKLTGRILAATTTPVQQDFWTPPIRFIERWWSAPRLIVLAHIFHNLQTMGQDVSPPCQDLLKLAFCRLVIQWSQAAFNHQSMSFKADHNQPPLFQFDERDEILMSFRQIVTEMVDQAKRQWSIEPNIIEGDSRQVAKMVTGPYSQVITSPPYPNRMSYIRELRPYMYWLGFLTEARQAGELDWQAIGGTWGIATSRLVDWKPDNGKTIDHAGFYPMLESIASSPEKHSQQMANYVHRYFLDMVRHFTSLKTVLKPGAEVVYIVGNSKFYDVLVPVEQIYVSIMHQCGFSQVKTDLLRKRNSKKELFEYAVIGKWI